MKKNELKSLEPAALLQAAETLFDEKKALEQELKDAQDALEAAGTKYAELAEKLDNAKSGADQKTFGEVIVGKQTYEIIRRKVNYENRIVTAEEIIAHKEIAEALVKIGASCMRLKA